MKIILKLALATRIFSLNMRQMLIKLIFTRAFTIILEFF